MTFFGELTAFMLGVLSSIVAELMLAYWRKRSIVDEIIHIVLRRNALKRLKHHMRGNLRKHEDPYNLLRAEMYLSLYDLNSGESNKVQTSLNSLFNMADILHRSDRDAAFHIVRSQIGQELGAVFPREFAEVIRVLAPASSAESD